MYRLFASLTLIDSMISFLTAFGLEALLRGNRWSQLSTGFVFGVVVLLILWCASALLETEAPFNLLDRVRAFAGSFRGTASDPRPDAEDVGDDDGQGGSGVSSRSRTFMKAFNRLRRLRRPRGSWRLVPINRTGEDRHPPPDVAAAEAGDANNDTPRGTV